MLLFVSTYKCACKYTFMKEKHSAYSNNKSRTKAHDSNLNRMKEKLKNCSKLEIFESLCTPHILDYIVKKSVWYSIQDKNLTDFKLF